ncbi:MAG: hypothetical protein Q9227_001648 [Pyrenula ochraceoflavens]
MVNLMSSFKKKVWSRLSSRLVRNVSSSTSGSTCDHDSPSQSRSEIPHQRVSETSPGSSFSQEESRSDDDACMRGESHSKKSSATHTNERPAPQNAPEESAPWRLRLGLGAPIFRTHSISHGRSDFGTASEEASPMTHFEPTSTVPTTSNVSRPRFASGMASTSYDPSSQFPMPYHRLPFSHSRSNPPFSPAFEDADVIIEETVSLHPFRLEFFRETPETNESPQVSSYDPLPAPREHGLEEIEPFENEISSSENEDPSQQVLAAEGDSGRRMDDLRSNHLHESFESFVQGIRRILKSSQNPEDDEFGCCFDGFEYFDCTHTNQPEAYAEVVERFHEIEKHLTYAQRVVGMYKFFLYG